MKTKDIAAKYGIDRRAFDQFLSQSSGKLSFSESLFGLEVADQNVEKYVTLYKEAQAVAENAAAKWRKAEQDEAERKRKCLSEMLISSGFSFDGYTITRYSGYISGDDAMQIPRSDFLFKNNNGQNLTDALVKIRRQALIELKEAAYNLGCNAVVGVDFDYITLEPETANRSGGTTYEPYIICVTANGNAVVIEKNT